jgi:hypothetical protein
MSAIEYDYSTYLLTIGWKMRRDMAIWRAAGRCQVCYGMDRLEAHHRTYDRLGEEMDSDITVLCHECHELFHKAGKLRR